MKYKGIAAALVFAAVSFTSAKAQSESDSTGLPGDNFNLKGALDLFRKAKSPEEFERMLNDETSKVNNLDLNNDGKVDYVRVIDKEDGDAHAIVLQVPVSETESQDVAVIELEKTGDREAQVQIVGDEDLYGERTVVEPQEAEETSIFNNDEDMASGPSANDLTVTNSFIFINCWDWPFVQFVFAPAYVPWISPWDWWHRPVWYRPFGCVSWGYFYSRPRYYHYNYAYVGSLRSIRCQQIYRPYRVTSGYVRSRNSVVVNRYRTARPTTVYNRSYNRGGYDNRNYNRGGYDNRNYNRGDARGYDNRNYNNNSNGRVNRDYSNNRQRDYNRSGADNGRTSPDRNYNPNAGNVQRNDRDFRRVGRSNNNYNRGGDVQFRNPNYNFRQRSERRAEPRERNVERRESRSQNEHPSGGRPRR